MFGEGTQDAGAFADEARVGATLRRGRWLGLHRLHYRGRWRLVELGSDTFLV